MKLTHSQKIIILSVFIFIATLVADVIFTNLLLTKIISINDKVKQMVLSSQEREKELTLRESVVTSAANRAKLEQYFVPAGDAKTAEFITYLESLAKGAGLAIDIRSVGYEPVAGLGSSSVVSSIRFRLNIRGDWARVFRFLQAIENLPRVISVNGVMLSASADKIWSADIDLSVVKLIN